MCILVLMISGILLGSGAGSSSQADLRGPVIFGHHVRLFGARAPSCRAVLDLAVPETTRVIPGSTVGQWGRTQQCWGDHLYQSSDWPISYVLNPEFFFFHTCDAQESLLAVLRGVTSHGLPGIKPVLTIYNRSALSIVLSLWLQNFDVHMGCVFTLVLLRRGQPHSVMLKGYFWLCSQEFLLEVLGLGYLEYQVSNQVVHMQGKHLTHSVVP